MVEMDEVIDNREIDEVLEKLEMMEDEELAAKLLAELDVRTSKLSNLLMNKDPRLHNDEWLRLCAEANEEVEELVSEILEM